MGSTASKFKKNLLHGEEYAALHMYDRHPELRRCIDPNASLGEINSHNTYLHFACKNGMKTLVRIFLADLAGNPNKTNATEMTSLHILCQSSTVRATDASIRAECLALLLAWEGSVLSSLGEKERVLIDAVDSKGNSALHYAAGNNLRSCVELLIAKGANMFLENEAKETACDCAEREGFHEIAQYLETKMVFSPDETGETLAEEELFPVVDVFSGLREQELREAKDQLLVETSDMLHVPLFTAEALLRNHEWSREKLLDSWMRNVVDCCEKCGVHPPASFLAGSATNNNQPSASTRKASLASETNSKTACDDDKNHSAANSGVVERKEFAGSSYDLENQYVEEDGFIDSPLKSPINKISIDAAFECGICTYPISSEGNCIPSVCEHHFCRCCWRSYLDVKIQHGDLNSITCPAYNCSKLVPVELFEMVLSPQMARKYLKFDIKAFVDSCPKIKWCPIPGCQDAVRLPDADVLPPLAMRVFPRMQPPPPTSRTVYCPRGHSFCWDCSAEGHEPTSCDKWRDWATKISQVKPEELKTTASSTEAAANCLWLVTHSKPCPKCKSPIQKNEGCNHMKCSKCKHEFCWVCLTTWKKHGTETGGFFRCNRFDDSRKAEERNEAAIAEATEANKRQQEINKFIHYYTRFKNHLNSYEMEKPLLDKVDGKIEQLAKNMETETKGAGEIVAAVDTKFVKDAVLELLRSRKVLSSSYAYGYFLKDHGYNKTIFEYLQNELEVSVESLSALVARPYLRSSRSRIIHTTYLVRQKRQSFNLCISRGLMPPETPPGLRKLRKRHLPAIIGIDSLEEDEWLKSMTTGDSLTTPNVDSDRPWVKDNRGRHRNLYALLNWDEQDEDVEAAENLEGHEDGLYNTPSTSAPAGFLHKTASTASATTPGVCSRPGCNRVRARNPRTGVAHAYCSLRCRYLDTSDDEDYTAPLLRNNRSYNVDLMIALQMSRLQLLHDLKLLDDNETLTQAALAPIVRQPSLLDSRSLNTAPNFPFGEDIDPDLQIAIERSMNEAAQPTGAAQADMDENIPMVHRSLSTASATSNSQPDLDSVDLKTVSDDCIPADPQSLAMFVRRFAAKDSFLEKANLLSSSTSANADSAPEACALDERRKVDKLLLTDVKQKSDSSVVAAQSQADVGGGAASASTKQTPREDDDETPATSTSGR